MIGHTKSRIPFKAVLFDHDGVLVASEPLHWDAWRLLLAELGLPYPEAEIRAMVGTTAPEIISAVLTRYRPGWTPAQYDIHALAQRKNQFYLASVQTGLRAYPGVPEGLKYLKANGILTAVVSNARRRELVGALDLLGLSPLFTEIVSRDDVKAFKPDPTPYIAAAAMLGLEPTECIAIEDSPTGLEAALLAKTQTAAVMTNFSRQTLESPVPGRPDLKPVWVGPSMIEFFKWLGFSPESPA